MENAPVGSLILRHECLYVVFQNVAHATAALGHLSYSVGFILWL